ncbi:MAG: hypothetical protein J0626_03210, partial [Rhodospirillaceae bacterium]|nr:hypothetical protein [Rhodospirillaceae bacterium]
MIRALESSLEDWERGSLPAYAMWRYLAKRFASVGLLDPAREAGRHAMAAAPDEGFIRVEQAQMEWAAGADDVALQLAESIPLDHPAICDALLVLADLSPAPDPDLAAEITAALMVRRTWESVHARGLALLHRWGDAESAVKFLLSWIQVNGATPPPLVHLAQTLLEAGHHDQAAPILANLWTSNTADLDPLIGPPLTAISRH